MRFNVLLLCALTALPISAPVYGAMANCTYTYVQTFQDTSSVSDSYRHSPVCLTEPEVHLDGVLVWTGSGRLTFSTGFDPGFDAFMFFRFPLNQSQPAGVREGQLDLDVAVGCRGYLQVQVLMDGAVVVDQTVNTTRLVTIMLPPGTTPGGHVEVRLIGDAVCLRSMRVCLDAAVPTRGLTWGQVKTKYGR